MAKNSNQEPLFVAGMGESPADRENGADMAKRYAEATKQAEKENEERLEAERLTLATRPVVALGTAEAIALGVGAGESPTDGPRPEGWEFVSEDVRKVNKIAGDIAEVRAEGAMAVEEATREADAKAAAAVAEAEAEAAEETTDEK
jgi:hypothetical protein